MLLSMVARGQDFNPDSPPEPGARYKLTLKAQPAEAATVSGGGLYAVNANVSVKAVARNANWRFKNWTDAEGKEVSKSSTFTHRKLNSAETLTANYEYQKTSRLTIAYDPSSIRTSEVKEYVVGITYSFTASTYSDYTFVNWTTSDGTVISTERTVSYTVTENDETITAHYRFTPGSPAEPNETKPKHKVYFRCDPAGLAGFNKTSGFSVSEGSPYSVTVYSVSDYEFKGWTWEGETKILETSRTWNVNMGTRDAHLVAHFEFKPSSPSEPSTDTKQRHSLYATTTSMYRGETTLLPIYMQNTGNVKTLSFKLHLPKNLKVDVANIQKTLRTDAYTVQAAQEDSVLSVSLEGGTQIVEHDGVVVRIPVSAQEALKDSVYTVKFSDIAGTTTADAVINFTSRSGRLVVSTPEEGDLQAKFSVETYMNRAQFTNLSSENAKTFEWNFGDGATSTERNPMHSYAEAGTYTVRLTARGIVKTVTAEQQIIINPANTWSASGDYRLDPTANTCVQVDARNALSAVAVYARRHHQRKDRRQGGVRRQSPVGRLAGAAQHADGEVGQGGRRDGVQERSAEPRYAALQRGSQQHRHAEGYRLLPPYLARQRGGNAQRSRDKHRRDRPLLGTDHLFGHKHAARSVHRYKQQRESEGEVDGKCG